ncbi:hypothetical protein N9C66_04260 [Akkermansiaceae bacterium]|nr:hypothetical protein [Akkermansiaceae bacterium]MDA7929484.1 hypothetical protein [Akkermansiaceae bacterium]MDA7934262.1 hypothetical protein [Akkermansiaceae bacterium]MDA9830531.1 hypothetical protein [Akkermansiaceae bacterium]MDB4370193.1 hypothetical protein [Akkermansiaceae bacterium]
MKSLFYFLAIAAIGAAGFFGWTAKENYTAKLAERDGLIQQNKNLSRDIGIKETEEEAADAALKLAQKEDSKAKAELASAEAKANELASTLDSIGGDLEIADAEKKKIDDAIDSLRAKFPGIELEEVPRVVKGLEDEEKKLVGEEEESSLVKKRLEDEVAKNLAETSRIVEKINQSIERVEGNTFQATIVAVDNDWNFVVIGAGEKSGLTGDSKLLIQRNGRLLGKLLISKLEPNSAVADVEPGSLKNGVALQPGDQVILESVRSN